MTTTDTTDTVEADDDIAGIWARYLQLREQRAAIDDEATQLAERLRKAAHVGQRVTHGGVPLYTLSPNRRFNVDAAAALLSPTQLETCVVQTLDAKRMKAQLPPVLLEQCMVEVGEPKVMPV